MKSDEQIATFCENVKMLRERSGLSKKEMAEIMGIGIKSLEKIENGVLPPRTGVDVLIRLSQKFDIRLHEFLMPL